MGKFRFILGAATGAVAALLFAPRSGKETRQLLTDKIEDVADRAPESVRSAAEPIIDAAEDAYSKVSAKGAQAKPETDDIKAKIAQARDALAEQITRNHAAATTVDADVVDIPTGVDDIVEDERPAAEQEDVAEDVEEPADEPASSQNSGWYN